jgi:DNA-binding NtrC family response regulator
VDKKASISAAARIASSRVTGSGQAARKDERNTMNTNAENTTTNLPPVLVIDDDPHVLRTLEALCGSMHSPHLTLRSSTDTALEAAMDPGCGLIVCDYRFPGDSGVDFIRSVRQRGVDTPVLFISGTPDAEAVLGAAGLPNTAFLGKPFTIQRFRSAIWKLLGMEV